MAGTGKGRYKITNWSKYNESLVRRGSITVRFSEDVIDKWHHANAQSKIEHPFVYSDNAVACLLVLFQLPYHQTEGLRESPDKDNLIADSFSARGSKRNWLLSSWGSLNCFVATIIPDH